MHLPYPRHMESLFNATAINHVALRVSDLETSRAFYENLVGARVYRQTDTACFLEISRDNFLALFTSDRAFIEHFCFTFEGYDADEVAQRLEAAGYSIHRKDDRVFVEDPDGLLVQLSAPEFE